MSLAIGDVRRKSVRLLAHHDQNVTAGDFHTSYISLCRCWTVPVFQGFKLGSYHVSPTTTWMDPPSISDLRRWGAPLTKVAPRCGESESSPFTKVAASRAGQVKGGVPCQAAATSRRTAPFMSVNAAPQLTRVAERIRSGESIACRGRDASRPAPPAQNRTCATHAYGFHHG